MTRERDHEKADPRERESERDALVTRAWSPGSEPVTRWPGPDEGNSPLSPHRSLRQAAKRHGPDGGDN